MDLDILIKTIILRLEKKIQQTKAITHQIVGKQQKQKHKVKKLS